MNEIILKMLLALLQPEVEDFDLVWLDSNDIYATRKSSTDSEYYGDVEDALKILRELSREQQLRNLTQTLTGHLKSYEPLRFDMDYKALEEEISKEFEKGTDEENDDTA